MVVVKIGDDTVRRWFAGGGSSGGEAVNGRHCGGDGERSTGRECVASVNVTILIAGMPIAAVLFVVTSMAKFR